MVIRFLFLFVLIALPGIPGVQSAERIFRSGCVIFRPEKIIKTLPGSNCLILPDGRFFSASNTSLKLIDKTEKVLWELPGSFHHQMSLSEDHLSLLALTSVVKDNVRRDHLVRVSLDGKILAETPADELIRKTGQSQDLFVDPQGSSQKQISHFNSISEVPRRKGQVIANSLRLGIFILSPDLRTVISHRLIPQSKDHSIHDVQATTRGTILFFNNDVNVPGPISSGVQEMDLTTGRIVFEILPGPYFYSPHSGSVQEIDADTVMFSHAFSGAYFYSRSKKKLIETMPGSFGFRLNFRPVFEVKVIPGFR